MTGRYGVDKLSRFLIISAIVFFVLSYFVKKLFILSYIGDVFVILAYFRCFSKNISRRNYELNIYNSYMTALRKRIDLYKRMWSERREYKYFKCKRCNSFSRIPKGVGKAEITCRVCGNRMIKKA